jgi:hypothetical protein
VYLRGGGNGQLRKLHSEESHEFYVCHSSLPEEIGNNCQIQL